MLDRGGDQSSRACALLEAIDDQEITVSEFADGLQFLTSDFLQVLATVLHCRMGFDELCPERLMRAHSACMKLASVTRPTS